MHLMLPNRGKLMLTLSLHSIQAAPALDFSVEQLHLLVDLLLRELDKRSQETRQPAGAASFAGRDLQPILESVRTTYTNRQGAKQLLVTFGPPVHAQFPSSVQESLGRLQEHGIRNSFVRRLAKELGWMLELRLRVAEYICTAQEKYLETRNAADLAPLHVKDVAQSIGYHPSTISKAIKNQDIRLEKGETVHLRTLTPGEAGRKAQIVTDELRQLASDPKMYSKGRWHLSEEQIALLLQHRTGLRITRRNVGTHLQALGYSRKVGRSNCVVCGKTVFRVPDGHPSAPEFSEDELDRPLLAREYAMSGEDVPCCGKCRTVSAGTALEKAKKLWAKSERQASIKARYAALANEEYNRNSSRN